MHTSDRINQVISSPIRKFLPLVRQAEKQGVKIYKLNIGDPDIEPPGQVFNCLKNFNRPDIGYSPSPGLPEHMQAWLKYYHKFNLDLSEDNVLITTGASEAIWMALVAVADPGDEVIVFEPFYTNYKGLATITNIKLKPVTLKIENDFALPGSSDITKHISPKTKAIIVINPDNPTGKCWTDKELKRIVGIASKHKLFIISDETYREMVFSGQSKSLLNFSGTKNNTIVIDSVSKRFSLPGIRIGCAVSYNQDIIAKMLKIAMLRLSASTVGQIVTTPILQQSEPYIGRTVKEYKNRKNTVAKALRHVPGLGTSEPKGAFYQVIKLPLPSSEDFVKFLLRDFRYKNQTLLLTPMADFYLTPGLGQNQVRLAYVLNCQDLAKAMEVFKQALKAYPDHI